MSATTNGYAPITANRYAPAKDRSAKHDEPRSVAEIAALKKHSVEFLQGLGVHDDSGRIGITYFDQAGEKLFPRQRPGPAGQRFYQPAGVKLQPYGLWKIDEAHKARSLILVEGESDCWALWYHRYPALGIPGNNAAGCLTFDVIDGLEGIWIHREPDAGGETFAKACAEHLRAIGFAGLIKIFWLDGVKDPADLHLQTSPEAFKAALEGAIANGTFFDRPEAQSPAPAPPRRPIRPRAKVPIGCAPFPTWTLPWPVNELVEQGAASIRCHQSYIVLPVLAALGAAIGNTRRIFLKASWTEPAVVWVAIVGDSGQRKSPALEIATKYLELLDQRRHEEFEGELEGFKISDEKYRYERKHKFEGTARPTQPTCQRLMLEDTSLEALIGVLRDGPRGTLINCDELDTWFSSMGRYSATGSASADRAAWLKLHGGRALRYNRKTGDRPSVLIPRSHVCIAGGIQEYILKSAFTPEARAAGLMARLLAAMPPKIDNKWNTPDIDPVVIRAYESVIDRLLALSANVVDGKPFPHNRRFGDDALRIWEPWFDQNAEEQGAAYGDVAAGLAKLEGYTARFALIHHVIRHAASSRADDVPIDAESVNAAIEMQAWFKGEMRRIYSALDAPAIDREAQRLFEYIGRRSAGGRQIEMRRVCDHIKKSRDQAETMLEPYERAGLVQFSPPGTRKMMVWATGELPLRQDEGEEDDLPPEAPCHPAL